MNRSLPVVILRSGHHGGLGIVRSLGRLGVPVYCVDSAWWEPAFSSRYCQGRLLLNLESHRSDQNVDHLLDIGRKLGGRALLIPATDQSAIWVAENATVLRETFDFPAQDAALVRALCDKGRMQELARQHGVPTAQSVVPRSKQDVIRFLDTASFPIVVKATDAERLRLKVGGTKFLVETPGELLQLYCRAEEGGEANLLFQEFIPGEDWMFNGYFDMSSRCLFGMTGKKIRRFPTRTGVTSLGVCIVNEVVESTTKTFMKAIGYQGILDIGFRYDFRDQKYKVLDVNPRIGCTFRLFVSANDLDVVRALYFDIRGQPLPPTVPIEGRRWLVEDFDMVSSLRLWLAGGLTVREWIKSLIGVREFACFAFDDPLPFLLMGAADCGEFSRWVRIKIETRKGKSRPSSGIEPGTDLSKEFYS